LNNRLSRHPWLRFPRLAAAVPNAGALGMVTLTWSADVGAIVRETAALTARPFGGNLVLTEDQHHRLDQALEAGLRIVSFMWGDPSGYIEPVHDAGGVVMQTVGSAEEARRAVASGVDVVVAQGWEAGGHVWGTVAVLPLVPAVVDAVAPVPVIAAGGIGDARGVAAVLALGAQAAWLGTRFLMAEEMPIHEDYAQRGRRRYARGTSSRLHAASLVNRRAGGGPHTAGLVRGNALAFIVAADDSRSRP
jgi:nitronate monooxygenase